MEKIIHFLIPRDSNNHKAKILHTSSLFTLSLLFIALQLIFNFFQRSKQLVLGFASNISPSEVVRLTNLKRQEAGLSELTINKTLSDAAYSKGVDMINNDYWAHVSPTGTEPWAFFNSFGYKYRYAGENLARDFSSPSSAVEAWMESPSHRENILNPKYKEIGIGVVEGDLSGSDTTIIVQFFGTKYSDTNKPVLAEASKITDKDENVTEKEKMTTKNEETINDANLKTDNSLVLSKRNENVLVSPFVTTKNTSLVVVVILTLVFLVDWFIVAKRRISRISGKTFAHVAFLGMILSVLLILKAGRIV